MQTVSGNWAGYLASNYLQLNYGCQISFPQTLVTSNFFTIGTSLIGGPDIIKSGGSAVAFFDKYQYTDYSSYVVSMDVQQRISQYPYGIIMAQADVTLDNSSGLFTPNFDPTIGPYILAGRPIKLSMGYFGEVLQQFTGFTTNPQIDQSEKTVTFSAYDVFNFIAYYQSTTVGVQVNQRADQIIAAGLNEMGFSSSQYVLDMSLMEPIPAMAPYGLYWGDIFQSLCEGEQGLMFADENGIIHFWNRQHMLSNSGVDQVLDYSVIEQIQTEDTPIINDVIVTATPRAVAADQQVWSLGTPQLLPPNTTTTVEADFSDDDGTMPVTSLNTLVAYTSSTTSSYEVNTASDGSGADKTGAINISSTNLYGSLALIAINNPTSQPLYLTAMTLWGTPAKVTSPVTTRYTDAASVAAYGTNPGNNGEVLEIGPDYIQDPSTAKSVAYTLVHEFKDGRQRHVITTLANPAIQMGDTIQVNQADGYALSFDGTGSSYVSVPSASNLDLTGDFTIAFWVNPVSVSGNNEIMEHGTLGSAGAWKAAIFAGGKITFTIPTVVDLTDPGSLAVAINVWNEVVITRSGTTYAFYLNGAASGTLTDSHSVSASAVPLIIGRRSSGTLGALNGQLDDVRLIKGTALTAAQVATMNSTMVTPTPFTSEWRFDEGYGSTTALDQTNNGDIGTITNPSYIRSSVNTSVKTMYVTGRTPKAAADEVSHQLELEDRLIESYFTIGVSTIGGTDTLAP